MKKTLIFALSVLATAYTVSAATVTVESGFSEALKDSSGNAVTLGTGFIAAGYFNNLSDSDIQNVIFSSTLDDNFVVYGSSGTVGDAGFSGFINFSTGTQPLINNGDPIIGNNVFWVAGNGSSLADSDSVIVFKSNEVFAAETPPTGTTFAFNPGDNGSYLLGSETGTVFIPEASASVNAIQMASVTAVPEPSSTARLGLGSVALLLRRRR
jgi:hypothetical protein